MLCKGRRNVSVEIKNNKIRDYADVLANSKI